MSKKLEDHFFFKSARDFALVRKNNLFLNTLKKKKKERCPGLSIYIYLFCRKRSNSSHREGAVIPMRDLMRSQMELLLCPCQ